MPNLTMSIPHQLSRAEARHRIQGHIGEAHRQFGSLLGDVHHRWSGDTLDFMLSSAGQTVIGKITVEDHVVRVEVALPWMFAMLANVVKQNVESEGRRLLGPPGRPQELPKSP